MDLAKFLNLIIHKELFFTNLNHFVLSDPYEGIYPQSFTLSDPSYSKDHLHSIDKGFRNLARANRRNFWISCWHINDHESTAMWKLYGVNESAIAIKTRLSTLKKSFDSKYNIHTGIIDYMDYEKDSFGIDNTIKLVMQKRKSFTHENELRAVIWSGEQRVDDIDKNVGIRGYSGRC